MIAQIIELLTEKLRIMAKAAPIEMPVETAVCEYVTCVISGLVLLIM